MKTFGIVKVLVVFVVLGAGRWSGRERECGPQVAPVHVFCSNRFCVASVATANRSLASLNRVFAANRARSTTSFTCFASTIGESFAPERIA